MMFVAECQERDQSYSFTPAPSTSRPIKQWLIVLAAEDVKPRNKSGITIQTRTYRHGTKPMKILISTFTLLALIATHAHAEKFTCKSSRGFSAHQIEKSATHDHTKYAPLLSGLVKEFAAYTSVFDSNDDDNVDGEPDLLANPTFVAYELKGVIESQADIFEEPDISIKRPGDWYKSTEYDFLWTDRDGITKKRIDNSYDGIGVIWNRGHLAMADHAQRISWEASCNTHHYWNASPQAADLNQGPWRHLETYTAAAANKFGRVWILTGPIFDDGKEIFYIGESHKGEIPIAVPHAFFKIVVSEQANGPTALGFIFEQPSKMGDHNGKPQPLPDDTWVNCNKANSQNHTYNHADKLTKIRDIASRTGLEFFANLPLSDRDNIYDAAPGKLWKIEKKFWDVASACARQASHE